jgi:hypothetical protein
MCKKAHRVTLGEGGDGDSQGKVEMEIHKRSK